MPPLLYTDGPPVLAAIDFENVQYFHQKPPQLGNTQFGVAVLDLKEVEGLTEPNMAITTYNYVVGSPEYYQGAQTKFLLGKPQLIESNKMLDHISSCIPQNRKIVLVAHALSNEMSILRSLGFDFRAHGIVSSIDTALISSQFLYNRLFPRTNTPSLARLLIALGCRYTWLHNGSNDANFIVRALLLLGMECCKDHSKMSRVRMLNKIGKAPLNCRTAAEEEALAEERAERARLQKERTLEKAQRCACDA